jgi:hypothetical protein
MKKRLWRRYETENRQFSDAWTRREAEIRKEVEESSKSIDERIQWVMNKENDLMMEETRLNELREELEERMRKMDEGIIKCLFCFSPANILILLTPYSPKRQEPSEGG